MGTIPLVALSARPPEAPDILGSAAKAAQIGDLLGQNAMQPGQQQLQQQQIQSQQNTLQQQQQAMKDQGAITKAWQSWDGKDPNQLPSLVVQNGGSGQAAQQAVQHITETRQKAAQTARDEAATGASTLDQQIKQNDEYRGRIMSVINAPADQQHALWDQEITKEEQSGQVKPGEISHQYPGDEQAKVIANHFALGSVLSKEAIDQEAQARLARQEQQTAANQAQQRKDAEAVAAETRRHNKITESIQGGGTGGPGGGLSPEAMDQAAERYSTTGQLPPASRGVAGLAQSRAIINRAAELHPGQTLAANSAEYKANEASYKTVTGTLDTLSAFENSANKNMDQFLNLSKKLMDSGVPWLNTPIRNVNQNLAGNEWMPAINAARSVMDREIARVTNDPKLSGSLTDAARKEVSDLNPANATLPAIVHLTQTLRNDMANVHTSLAEQKKDIGTRLGLGGGAQGGGQSQAGAPSKPHNATHTGVGSVDKKKHWLDAQGHDLGLAE